MSDTDGNSGDAQKITGEVTILGVGDQRREWKSSKGGEFIAYRVKLRLADGTEHGNVEVNTKKDNPKFLAAGDTEFGVFDPRPGNQYGPRFQRKSPDGGGGGRRGGPSPMEQCRMQRQHSQMVAVDFAAKAGWLDGITPDDAESIKGLIGNADGPLTKLIDVFDHDIDRGAKKALERRQQSGSE